jgi:hypothetical protein
MKKYFVTYRVWSDYQTVVEADSEEDAYDIVVTEGIDGINQDLIMSDFDYDNIDIMETE